jgi:hypothetical protein
VNDPIGNSVSITATSTRSSFSIESGRIIPDGSVISYDSYMSTEYYCDFLRPYGIHYKLVVYLKAREGLQGKVVLHVPGAPRYFPRVSRLWRASFPPIWRMRSSITHL